MLAAPDAPAESQKHLELPEGEVAERLRRFSEIYGRETLFSAKSVRGIRTAAVGGRCAARGALERMHPGAGLIVVEDQASGAPALRPGSASDRPTQRPAPRSRSFLRTIVTGAAAALANVLAAQTAPAASNEREGAQAAIVLSPFEVNASQDQGYIATNTLSGSRVNTPLYSTPSVTSVFTRDFLDDIAANDLVEAYAYGLNVDAEEQPEQSSNFRGNIFSDNAVKIRGLTAATARNYFVWSVNGDAYSLERIDFSRGPNNILFGLGGQGGVVNSTTKRALLGRDITRAQLRVGNWDLYRGHLDFNRSFKNKVAVRVNLLHQNEGGWKNHASYDREGMHLAGTWRIFNTPSASLHLRADYEMLHIDRVLGFRFPLKDAFSTWNGAGIPASGSLTGVEGTGLMPANRRVLLQGTNEFFLSTGVRRTAGPSGTSLTDESIVPREANYNGPDQRNDSDVENVTVLLEQKLFRDLFIELAFNRQSEIAQRNQVDGFDVYRDPRQTVNGTANPYYGDYFSEYTYALAADSTEVDEQRITASYERDFGKYGRHQIAALASRRENRDDSIGFNFDDIGTNGQLLFRRYVSDGDGTNNTGFDPARLAADAARANLNLGYRQGTLSHNESRQDTLQAVHVGNFFSGRLSTVFGIRKDELSNRNVLNGTTDVVTDEPLFKRRRQWNNYQLSPWTFLAEDITRTKGFTLGWSAESPVRVYYNESESFVNQGGALLVGLLERNRDFPPRVGEGKDMGLRFRLFNQRVQGSVGYFETNDLGARHFIHGAFNSLTRFVSTDVLRTPGHVNWQDTVDLASSGYEFELTANPTRNWRLHFNYSRTDLETSNQAPNAKRIVLGQLVPEWTRWVGGWRQGSGETLPAGVSDNTAAAVTVSELGRPLTFLEAHGGGINPTYSVGDRSAQAPVTGAMGLADWISRVNWAAEIWFQDGLPPRRHRRDNFSFVANYTFDRDSRFKGWTVGASARWRGKPIIDRYFDPASNVVLVWGDARVDTDLNFGYSHRFARFTLKTQLNVKNVFDSDTTEVINVAGNADERGHLQWHDPQSLRLTVDFMY